MRDNKCSAENIFLKIALTHLRTCIAAHHTPFSHTFSTRTIRRRREAQRLISAEHAVGGSFGQNKGVKIDMIMSERRTSLPS
jgi:hypothetical protein